MRMVVFSTVRFRYWAWGCILLVVSLLVVSCGETMDAAAATADLSPLKSVRHLARENDQIRPSFTAENAYPAELQAIHERGSIIFAMTASDQKPFFYQDEASGELIGLDVELAYEIANRLGVTAVFNRDAGSFDGVVQKITDGEADVALSKLSRTMRRAERVRYTRPYIVFRQGLMVNRLEFAKVGPEESLPGFIKNFQGRMGIIKNSSYINYAAINFPGASVETYDTWNETVDALMDGKVLAVYRDEGEILVINATRKNASILLKPVFFSDKLDPIAMAVSVDAPVLQEWLNIFIEEYTLQNQHELTANRLVDRHFKNDSAE